MPNRMTIAASVGPGIMIATTAKTIATTARSARAHQLPVHTSTIADAVIGLSPFLRPGRRSGRSTKSEAVDADYLTRFIVVHDLDSSDEPVGLFHCPDFFWLDHAVVPSLNLELDRSLLRIVGDTSKLSALHRELVAPIGCQDFDVSRVGRFAKQEVFGECLEAFLELIGRNFHRIHFVTLIIVTRPAHATPRR